MNIEDESRPISLTSKVAKVMEGCTLGNFLPQIVDNLDPRQFALPKYLLHTLFISVAFNFGWFVREILPYEFVRRRI